MWFYKGRIMSEGQLERISAHKYNCVSLSIVEPLLQPWWTWCVNRVPLWLAPNLITITGLFINIISTLLLIWNSPDAKQAAPRWAYITCGTGLFLYQTLDAIDGKQARRTCTSSPLGELFDHGCDSISTAFVGLSGCIAVLLGHYPQWLFVQCFFGMVLFFCAHWQTYVSGTMSFRWFDVTEAQWCIISLHVISATFGPEVWLTVIHTPFGETHLNFAITFLFFIGYVLTLVQSLYAVASSKTSASFPRDETTSTLDFYWNILSPGIPLLCIITPAILINVISASNVYENHPVVYILAFGLISSKVSNRLVVAHMTKSGMGCADIVFLGPLLLLLNQYTGSYLRDGALLVFCLVWATCDLFFYSLQVCHEICEHLSIELFTIPSECGPGKPYYATASRIKQGLKETGLRLKEKGQQLKEKGQRFRDKLQQHFE